MSAPLIRTLSGSIVLAGTDDRRARIRYPFPNTLGLTHYRAPLITQASGSLALAGRIDL